MNGVWTEQIINNLELETEYFNFPFFEVQIDEVFKQSNPGYEKCLCGYCQKIVRRPLVVKDCEHGMCISCFRSTNINSSFSDTVCPVCNSHFNFSEIKASSLLPAMIKNLRIRCDVGCNQELPYTEIESHKSKCRGISEITTISQIMALSPQDELPKQIHSVVGHGLKIIMAKSEKNTVEVKTRGQVIIIYLDYLDYFFIRTSNFL